jgi:hypothetical protein
LSNFKIDETTLHRYFKQYTWPSGGLDASGARDSRALGRTDRRPNKLLFAKKKIVQLSQLRRRDRDGTVEASSSIGGVISGYKTWRVMVMCGIKGL